MSVIVDPMRLQQLAQEAIFTAVEPQRTPPETPRNVVATGRNFGILVQWGRVDQADGYVVIVADDEDFSQPILQRKVPGENALEWFYNTGNAALTRYFRVQSYRGDGYSAPSASVSATSINADADAVSLFAGDVGFNNVETDLAQVTLTSSGRAVLVIGNANFSQNGGDKDVWFRLKEDGGDIVVKKAVARNTASGFGWDSTILDFRTPAAGSHVYKITAQNNTDATSCLARCSITAAEIPFVTSAEVESAAADPPAPPQSPPQPDSFPTGPGAPYGRY